MALSRFNLYNVEKNTPINLYSDKQEALANERDGNQECLTVYYDGAPLYAATNSEATWPNNASLCVSVGNKIRYVHPKTYVTKTKAVYGIPSDVSKYESAQAAFDSNPSIFSDVPGRYEVWEPSGQYEKKFNGYYCQRIKGYQQKFNGYYCRYATYDITGYSPVYVNKKLYYVTNLANGLKVDLSPYRQSYTVIDDFYVETEEEANKLAYNFQLGMVAVGQGNILWFSVGSEDHPMYSHDTPVYDVNNPHYSYSYIQGPDVTTNLLWWNQNYPGYEPLSDWFVDDTSKPIYENVYISGPREQTDSAYNNVATFYSEWLVDDTSKPILKPVEHDKTAYTVSYSYWY